MLPTSSLSSFALRNVRTHGPRLLGASRRVFRDAQGRQTPFLELGAGQPETLIFFHGFGDRPEHFLATAKLLARRFRVLVPSMPGFGDGHLDVHAEHSLEWFGAFATTIASGIGGDRFHLMGNSLGGAASMSVAHAIPERLASLTLVDAAGVRIPGVPCVFEALEESPNPFVVHDRDDFDAFTRKVSSRPNPAIGLFANALYDEARANAFWYDRIGRDMVKSIRSFVDRDATCFLDLSAIHVPTLVVWGEHDALFPVAHGRHIASTVPDARFEQLDGVGHCPHLEAPLALARAFERFAPVR